MKAVIMAGGLGARLAPLTKVIPKPLLPVGEKSILEIQLIHLKRHGFKEIFLALGYKHELFEAYFGNGSKFGVKMHYSREKTPLGTAGPLRLIGEKLDRPFLVINGDILTNTDFRSLSVFHKDNKADLTVATKNIVLPLHYGIIKHKNNKVFDIVEKPSIFSEINAGIYFMNPGTLKMIPENKPYSMDALIKTLITSGRSVFRYELKDYWLDIGQMEDYNKAQEFLK